MAFSCQFSEGLVGASGGFTSAFLSVALPLGWVDRSTVMTIHGNEVLGPEELAELCAIFDDTWAAMDRCADSEWSSAERTLLASILLRLFGLRQLGPDQAKQSALRIFRQISTTSMGNDASTSDGIIPMLSKSPRAGKLRNKSGFSHLPTLNF